MTLLEVCNLLEVNEPTDDRGLRNQVGMKPEMSKQWKARDAEHAWQKATACQAGSRTGFSRSPRSETGNPRTLSMGGIHLSLSF